MPTTTANLHIDDYPAVIELLRLLLGNKRDFPNGYQPHDNGVSIDWDALDASWLSTSEKAVVHLARGLATIERQGSGPYWLDRAVIDAVDRVIGVKERSKI